MHDIQCLGVYTSGGDAPGMNACLRATVRTALANDLEVVGIRRGYEGMIDGDFVEMDRRSVSNIVQTGGTILKSARSTDFLTEEGRTRAADNLERYDVDGLIAIGGGRGVPGGPHPTDRAGRPAAVCPGGGRRRDADGRGRVPRGSAGRRGTGR